MTLANTRILCKTVTQISQWLNRNAHALKSRSKSTIDLIRIILRFARSLLNARSIPCRYRLSLSSKLQPKSSLQWRCLLIWQPGISNSSWLTLHRRCLSLAIARSKSLKPSSIDLWISMSRRGACKTWWVGDLLSKAMTKNSMDQPQNLIPRRRPLLRAESSSLSRPRINRSMPLRSKWFRSTNQMS